MSETRDVVMGQAVRSGERHRQEVEGLRIVGKPIRKVDAEGLVTGKAVYTDDLAPKDCLVVKLLRSPHANALVEEIDTSRAMKIPGVVGVWTWKDIDQEGRRYTQAGQTFPEASPYDRLLLDRHVRFVGDVVAIVAAEDERTAVRAVEAVKVKYQVLPAVLDFHKAKDGPVLVHDEDNWLPLSAVGGDNKRNLVASSSCGEGDIDEVLRTSDVVVEETYHTKAVQQTMMETFRTFCTIDAYGRLIIVSSTQIVFHVRRIVANALHIPKSRIRVIKPRIGGGFGAKQTSVSEVYPAFVTWVTKRPSKILFSREESLIASSPRHEMEMHVKVGATRDGRIRGFDLYTLSNSGAYGEHGPTTVGLSGHKSIPLYGGQEAFRFVADVVYTNEMSAGAYRGYGATQGIYAIESAVNELAGKLGMDPCDLRARNLVREGEIMPAFYNEINSSCNLDLCLARVKEMIDWDHKYPYRVMPDGKVRSVGIAMSMQGSGISSVDVGSVTLKLADEGHYNMLLGSADMGTGSDTTLSQVAAEVLGCEVSDITVYGADTDVSPYDSGSYASSTAYVTGKACEQAARELVSRICQLGVKLLNKQAPEGVTYSPEQAEFDGKRVYLIDNPDVGVSLAEVTIASQMFANIATEVTSTFSSPTSPPPFMVGAVELELDPLTGETRIVEFDGCVDCGTPLNENIVRGQTEGGVLQGLGMALTENITYDALGRLAENSLMQYKIPSRLDIGEIKVDFAPSYEERGPFGAKSIGEVVINTPGPAVAGAVYNATGVMFRELPITPEKVAEAFAQKREREKKEGK